MEATTVFCISCGKEVLVFPLGSSTETRPVTCHRCRERAEWQAKSSSPDERIDLKAILEVQERSNAKASR
jgi:DNA-directed RNA polymerase subunit RPC12/RpoP